MPFQPVTPEKLADAVARQIEALILRGILQPGERLPAERDLATRLDVSRPSLRAAVAELQAQGLLISKPNAGLFVADDLGATFPSALAALFSRHEEALFDYIDFRRDMEGLAAERAAKHATTADLELIQKRFDQMASADSGAQEDARLDAAFHRAIIEASHNVVMLHMMRSMEDMLQTGVFANREIMFAQQTSHDALLDQHRAINDALQARDPARARAAMDTHLSFIESALKAHLKTQANQQTAELRLAHEAP